MIILEIIAYAYALYGFGIVCFALITGWLGNRIKEANLD